MFYNLFYDEIPKLNDCIVKKILFELFVWLAMLFTLASLPTKRQTMLDFFKYFLFLHVVSNNKAAFITIRCRIAFTFFLYIHILSISEPNHTETITEILGQHSAYEYRGDV